MRRGDTFFQFLHACKESMYIFFVDTLPYIVKLLICDHHLITLYTDLFPYIGLVCYTLQSYYAAYYCTSCIGW